MSRRVRGRGSRHGGVLLEALLALALFVGAATFTLGVTRSVLRAVDRAGREAVALDLARDKLAELEVGLVTIAELREAAEGIDRVGSFASFGDDRTPVAWTLDIATQRTAFSGLTLVALTVTDAADGPGVDVDPDAVRVTLRQLVRLREEADEEYEEDDLLRGLPAADEPGGGAP